MGYIKGGENEMEENGGEGETPFRAQAEGGGERREEGSIIPFSPLK